MLVPQRVKTAPPLECYWKAHDAPVVSVEYIQHTSGDFVLSASTDKTARLWTPEGHYVGTFGQVRIDVSINSFTASACKMSGLKDAWPALQTVHFPVL